MHLSSDVELYDIYLSKRVYLHTGNYCFREEVRNRLGSYTHSIDKKGMDWY